MACREAAQGNEDANYEPKGGNEMYKGAAHFLSRTRYRVQLQEAVEEVTNYLADIADNLATIEAADDKDEKEAAHEEIEATAEEAIGQVKALLNLLRHITGEEPKDED